MALWRRGKRRISRMADTGDIERLKLELERARLEADTALKREELAIKDREIRIKEAEALSPKKDYFELFKSPITLALVGLLGTGIGAALQGYWNLRLEQQKFESEMIK